MAKHRVKAPCDYFDMATDQPKVTARCYDSVACDWYIKNVTQDDIDNDPQRPCKERYLKDDDSNIDMFEGG